MTPRSIVEIVGLIGGVAEVNWNDPKSIEEAVQRFAEQK